MDRGAVLDVTPVYFAELCEAYERRVKRAERTTILMLAQLTATTVNWSMHAPKERARYSDFLPVQVKPDKPVRKRRESKQQIAERLRQQMRALMG